jgi:RNA polymerase sigma factor (sigma-70 family)
MVMDATGGLRFQASDVGWSFMGRKADPLSDPAPLIRRVYAYVAYRIGDGPEAEDVSSEVFERALRYRWSYNPDKASPITWLMAIARRVVADRGVPPETTAVDEATDLADPLDVEAESVRKLDLRAAVAQLSERDRELIGLRYGADLSAAQIAELLESEPHAIEVSLSRAVSRLRSFATVGSDL